MCLKSSLVVQWPVLCPAFALAGGVSHHQVVYE